MAHSATIWPSEVAAHCTSINSPLTMNHDNENLELPQELQDALFGLGDLAAPSELDQRVAMSLMGQEKAPDELWSRVQPELCEIATTHSVLSAATPSPSHGGRLLSFPTWVASVAPVRLPAAAALLLFVGVSFIVMRSNANNATSTQDLLAQASTIRAEQAALRDQYRARVFAQKVTPSQLSPTARGLASSLGATTPATRGQAL